MTKNLDKDGLKSIADKYQLFYIDLWGVMHNGVKIYNNAILTLQKFGLLFNYYYIYNYSLFKKKP